jgi:hypothetical protein
MQTPLALGAGEHRQEVRWSSDGLWTLTETVLYDGVVGDTDVQVLTTNQELSANIYGEWVTQVNENPGLDLFIDGLDPFLDPTCTDLQARLTLAIRDDPRNRETAWTRCVEGPLSRLTPVGAKPDSSEAARVAAAAELVRNRTLGEKYESAFEGTLPFATIDRGEDSGADLPRSLLIDGPAAWKDFWTEHSRSQGPPPAVDFKIDQVLVAAVGQRAEAGDSVEIQRIRAGAGFLEVELHQRVPGNFCSPAERLHTPFHIVRMPRVGLPVFFNELPVQRVPCG